MDCFNGLDCVDFDDIFCVGCARAGGGGGCQFLLFVSFFSFFLFFFFAGNNVFQVGNQRLEVQVPQAAGSGLGSILEEMDESDIEVIQMTPSPSHVPVTPLAPRRHYDNDDRNRTNRKTRRDEEEDDDVAGEKKMKFPTSKKF